MSSPAFALCDAHAIINIISQVKYMWKYETYEQKWGDMHVPGSYFQEAIIHSVLRMNYAMKLNQTTDNLPSEFWENLDIRYMMLVFYK